MLPEVRRSRLLQERALKSVRAHLISAREPEVELAQIRWSSWSRLVRCDGWQSGSFGKEWAQGKGAGAPGPHTALGDTHGLTGTQELHLCKEEVGAPFPPVSSV